MILCATILKLFEHLRKKRFCEVISADTYFAKEESIEGYYCAQTFYGITFKTLIDAGTRTESEFTEIYLDFIRKNGIPSTPQRNYAKSEMSQRMLQPIMI
jgi:hypothetical protein